MELNEKHIELVGLYLQGRLEGDELALFLKEVEQNATLKKELGVQKSIQEGLEHHNNQELRARFKKIAAEQKASKGSTKENSKENTRVIPMSMMRILASAAAILLLCLAAYFLMQPSSDSDSLFAQYFEPSELTITRSTDLDPNLVKLKELYNTKKYDEAGPLFQKILEADPSSSNLRLAYGNTLMKCKKMDLARKQFTYILEAKDPLFTDQARWFLGLLELKAGKISKAKEYFSYLINDSNADFHAEAKALVKELEEIN